LCNVTAWRSSVRPSVCVFRWNTLHDSPGGSMRHDNKDDRHTCTCVDRYHLRSLFRWWLFAHAAAYLGDIALTEDELELLGVTNSLLQKPKPSAVSVTSKPPPPSPPLPLHRPRDAALERRRQRRRRRRKQWRLDLVDGDDNVRELTTNKHRQSKRRGNRQHRQSAEHSQHKRYRISV